jgi:cysteine-rich repeat protein
VAAYVRDPDSTTGFEIISGTASAEGVVRIEGVAEGTPFYLRLHDPQDPLYTWPRYFYTTQHQLDLGHVQLGRDDTPTTQDTQVTFELSGLRPWQLGDGVVAHSFNVGTSVGVGTTTPPDDATSFVDTVDWRSGFVETTFADTANQSDRVPQLIDSAAGDDLWVVQYGTTWASSASNRGYRTSTIVAAGQATGVDMADGQAATIPVTLAPTPPVAGGQDFSMNLGAFRTAFRDGGRYVTEDLRCGRSANPGGSYGLVHGAFASFDAPIWGGETSINLNFPSGNPFPASWDQVQWCSFQHLRYTIVPVENRRMYGYSYMTSYTTADDDYTWTPVTRPPSNIQIGGVDGLAGGAVDFDGVTPVTMSWDEVPGVNHYQVRVLGITEGFTAAFDTMETSIDMPADIFTQGNFYIFRVFALQTVADYTGGELYRVSLPMTVGRVSTGMFRFSAECGDSGPDTGEQCDTGGNSAGCDADCSLPVCGDGFVNTAATETCDEVEDAPLCDSDCTVPMCRDGHWNPTIEECDDGNATDGDGCSAACVLENCGDGTTQSPFESCDDSNRNNGDGCSAFCQPE